MSHLFINSNHIIWMKYYTGVIEVLHACLPLAQSYIYQYVSQVEAFTFLISLCFCIHEVTLAVNKIFSETGCAILCLHPVVAYFDSCESHHTHDNIVISCKLVSFVRLYILVLLAALLSSRLQVSVMSSRRGHPLFTGAARLLGHIECCNNWVAKLKRKCLIKRRKIF